LQPGKKAPSERIVNEKKIIENCRKEKYFYRSWNSGIPQKIDYQALASKVSIFS
jgi:hypothetical protein